MIFSPYFPSAGSGQGNKSSGNFVKGPIIGGPFTLIDTENQTITERNLRGKWVLLYFGYTSSPDVGPEQVQVMAKAIDKLGLPLNSTLISLNLTNLIPYPLLSVCFYAPLIISCHVK